MKFCPITLEAIDDSKTYSQKGLNQFSRRLTHLCSLPYSAQTLREESLKRMDKMSIQGIQQKLSATFSIKLQTFEIQDIGGTFILKPPSLLFDNLPENEALTMTLAKTIGLNVPFHGLIYNTDDTLTYFIKRFDRITKGKKLAVEDLAQVCQKHRKTKYQSSMEQVAKVFTNANIMSFPLLESLNLFRLTLFNYLIGNEDAHLKNFSVITENNKVSMSPVYDLLNSSIALKGSKEEIALPLNGKKNQISENDLFRYFAKERLHLKDNMLEKIKADFNQAIPTWPSLIKRSFLNDNMKQAYLNLVESRLSRLPCLKIK